MEKVIAYQTDTKFSGVSNKYKHVTSAELGKVLESHGFFRSAYNQASVRKINKQGFQKHIARFRMPSEIIPNSGLFPEIVLKNSHDGSGSIEISFGIYRLVCSNGLVVGKSVESVRLRHVGSVLDKLDQALPMIIAKYKDLAPIIAKMQGKILSVDEQRQLAKQMILSRLELLAVKDKQYQVEMSLVERLLTPKRTEDNLNDVFTVYNRIQENILDADKLYVRVVNPENENDTKLQKIRAIKDNTMSEVNVNKLLWDLAAQAAS